MSNICGTVRQTAERLDRKACGQHVLLRHRHVSLAVDYTVHLDTVVGVQQQNKSEIPISLEWGEGVHPRRNGSWFFVYTTLQYGGDASISIICASVGKLRDFVAFLQEKTNLKMKILLLSCQEQLLLLLLLLLLLQLLLYYLYVPLMLYVTAITCALVHALRLCTGRTAHRGIRGIALLFLDHGTRRSERSALHPGRSLPPGKTRYPLYMRLGGPQGRSGQVRKISPPPGFDPRTVQYYCH